MFDEKFKKKVLEDASSDWLNKIIRNDGIIVVPSDTEKYINDSEQLAIYNEINRTISKQLIIDVINNDYYFNILQKVFGGKGHFFSII